MKRSNLIPALATAALGTLAVVAAGALLSSCHLRLKRDDGQLEGWLELTNEELWSYIKEQEELNERYGG